MLGVIAGDVIGSVYERDSTKSVDFPLFDDACRFTDDTVMTVATARAILEGVPYERVYRVLGRRYPAAGYGASFYSWLFSDDPRPYNSWGNGSAMRVAPVGFAFDTVDDVLREAERSAAVTHDHPEGVKGAQSTALAVYLARSGASKDEIRTELTRRFGYDLDRTVEQIRLHYDFDVSCQGSVPESIIAFLDSESLEHAIRMAISLGGDSDTQAAIAGGIAHAFYRHIPEPIERGVRRVLPAEFIETIDAFERAYPLQPR
ncbi:MAG: ADP-ribosylglycohydrolase family protein [Gemmatimonadaceae bacterium]